MNSILVWTNWQGYTEVLDFDESNDFIKERAEETTNFEDWLSGFSTNQDWSPEKGSALEQLQIIQDGLAIIELEIKNSLTTDQSLITAFKVRDLTQDEWNCLKKGMRLWE